MRVIWTGKLRDGKEARVALAPNGTVWMRVKLTTGRWDYWHQMMTEGRAYR